jgi:carbon starvation protein CstA
VENKEGGGEVLYMYSLRKDGNASDKLKSTNLGRKKKMLIMTGFLAELSLRIAVLSSVKSKKR